jgi:hypothetical protein
MSFTIAVGKRREKHDKEALVATLEEYIRLFVAIYRRGWEAGLSAGKERTVTEGN